MPETVPTVPPRFAPLPRLALSKSEAAEALGVSVDHLERYVLPEVKVVYSGRRRLIPVRELERWLEQRATPAYLSAVRS